MVRTLFVGLAVVAFLGQPVAAQTETPKAGKTEKAGKADEAKAEAETPKTAKKASG